MYNLNYQEKNYNTIFESYLRKAAANGLINNNEEYIHDILNGESIENILIMDLAIQSEILTEIYKDLTSAKDSYDIMKAKGQELDQLLEPFLERRNSTLSTVEICLETDPNKKSSITIPPDTQITSTTYPEIIFQTIQDTTIPPETKKTIITAICTTPGIQGNIPSKKLDKLLNPINGIIKVYNPTTATGGRNTEDDNSYRLRGQNWNNINTQGTYAAFKNTIENIPDVENYYIQRRWDGPGTTRIIINPPTKKVLNLVKEELKDVCAVDEEYTIIGAENKPININTNITINTTKGTLPGTLKKEEMSQTVTNTLKTYIEGNYNPQSGKIGGLSMGEDFIPSRAAAHIINTQPLIKDVTITYPTSNISIDYYQKAICGEIHIEIR